MENLRLLRKRSGLTMKELADKVGVTESAVGYWETGKRTPKYEMLLKLGEALDCSVADIMDGETPAVQQPELDRKFGALDEHGKEVVRLVLDAEFKRCTNKPAVVEKPKKIIPLFGSSFAAGSFEPGTQDEPFEDCEVDADSKAEFAIRVSGDSMEPELKDGEIALCTKRRPQIGEIVVCLVNGSFYVKQFITDGINIYLRSINRNRKDADLDIWATGNYTVKCFGTVIHKRIPLVQQ